MKARLGAGVGGLEPETAAMLAAAERQLTRLDNRFRREDEHERTSVAQWWAQKQVEQPMADLRREVDEHMRRDLARLEPLVQA